MKKYLIYIYMLLFGVSILAGYAAIIFVIVKTLKLMGIL